MVRFISVWSFFIKPQLSERSSSDSLPALVGSPAALQATTSAANLPPRMAPSMLPKNFLKTPMLQKRGRGDVEWMVVFYPGAS